MGRKVNQEGYHDPTAYDAIGNVTRSDNPITRIKEMRHHFDYIAGLYGFRIENRIVFTDLNTGKEYR